MGSSGRGVGSVGIIIGFHLILVLVTLGDHVSAGEKRPLTKEQRLAKFEEALEDIPDEDMVETILSELRTPTKYIANIMDFFNTTVRLEYNVLQMLKVDGTVKLKDTMDEVLKGISILNKRIKNYSSKTNTVVFEDFVEETQEEFQDLMNAFILQYNLVRGVIEEKHDYVKMEFQTLMKTSEEVSESWVSCKKLGLVLDEDKNYKTDEAYREHVENYERNGDIELEAIEALSDLQDIYDHTDTLVAELENKIAMEKIDGKKDKKFFKEYNEILAFHEKALEFIEENAEELSLIKTSLEVNLLYLKDLLKRAADKYTKEVDATDAYSSRVDKAEISYKKEIANLRLKKKYLISSNSRDEF
ncbi:unnamed protein product [Allacma fusca]|uniref:Uncharacterized protein n=2 Tax=Allacma fusca TaxID=39272 RepID=A0A8J2NZL6_9HEXA|nr:unnamed protein product [Allacma fusca]